MRIRIDADAGLRLPIREARDPGRSVTIDLISWSDLRLASVDLKDNIFYHNDYNNKYTNEIERATKHGQCPFETCMYRFAKKQSHPLTLSTVEHTPNSLTTILHNQTVSEVSGTKLFLRVREIGR
jgi:hypothetical protein